MVRLGQLDDVLTLGLFGLWNHSDEAAYTICPGLPAPPD
jgi:hypothetical protein